MPLHFFIRWGGVLVFAGLEATGSDCTKSNQWALHLINGSNGISSTQKATLIEERLFESTGHVIRIVSQDFFWWHCVHFL